MPDIKIFYGWYIVGACFLLCFLFAGAGFYSFSIFIEPIEKQFGWNRAAISLTMSIYLVTGGLMGPVHGRLIGRFGPRRVMLVCAVGAGACFVLVSLTRWLWYFYLVYALLAATVCGMGVVPVSSLLSNWFDRRRGTATGIALVGISAGGLLLAPMVGLVTAVWGWQASFVIIGLMVWCIALPVVFFVIRDRPDQLGLLPEGGGRSVYGQAEAGGQTDFLTLGRPAGEVLRTRAFWCIFLSFFLAPMAQMGVLQHQVPLIMDTGMSHAYASVALGVTAGVGGLGKLSFGKMADIWPFQYVILLCFGLQTLSVLFLLLVFPLPYFPWNQHGDGFLVLTVWPAQIAHQIFFLQPCSCDNPSAPEHVENKPVCCNIRTRPDHQQRKEIQGVPDEFVGTPGCQHVCLRLLVSGTQQKPMIVKTVN
ncbi:MAG: MFS transporter [Desulfobacteraceae bacterium]|nr:MFS transporter [Desulfobacteraceae bacterium]